VAHRPSQHFRGIPRGARTDLQPYAPGPAADAAALPTVSAKAEAFYAHALNELTKLGVPFLLAGTYALSAYTGVTRATKDLDILCRPADYPTVLAHFEARGQRVAIEDDRWLAKVFNGDEFFDVIFASRLGVGRVNDRWFEGAPVIEMFGTKVRVVRPTELIWSKSFVQLRHRYDGPDIANLILKQHAEIDWRQLLTYMDGQWEVLFGHLLNFRWIYPSERDAVPTWLLRELADRVLHQLDEPPTRDRVCRGRMLSDVDYETAINDWGFADASCEELDREDR
jgi:hypothetical protein